MNQYFKPLIIGFMIIGLVSLSSLSVSAAQNQTSGSSDNMTAGGGNMTLQEEGTSGINMSVARNQSAGGGGAAPN